MKRAKEIHDELYRQLRPWGALKWHNNKSSWYIKFRDNRVGSIRISDHRGRQRYSYRWSINVHDFKPSDISKIVNEVIEKCKTIPNFNPKHFITWINGEFKKVQSFDEYKETIHKRGRK